MDFTIEIEQEADGRWLAEVLELPGVMTYGKDAREAMAMAKALALRVVADELEHSERSESINQIRFAQAA
jgi:predicted RNase H-like HicB family nuclease